MRVLVCGSRDWWDHDPITIMLEGLLAHSTVNGETLTIIDGRARGADAFAGQFSDGEHVKHERYPADWAQHGLAAGPIRNKQMLEEGKPDLVVAFSEQPITAGTANMIKLAKRADVPVWVVGHGG